METVETGPRPSSIANQRIGVIGKLSGMNRRELKQLVREHGGIVADALNANLDIIVVGDDGNDADKSTVHDPPLAQAAANGSLRILSETEFWQSLGLVDDNEHTCRLYTPTMLADLLNVSVNTVRRWYRRGLIRPIRCVHKLPYFDFQEIASARKIAELVSSGASPAAIEAKLTKLVERYPDRNRSLSQLSVVVEGKDLLLRSSAGLFESNGQRRFEFAEHDDRQTSSPEPQLLAIADQIPTRDLSELTSPDDFIRLAVELEDADEIEAACEIYRSLLLAHGPSADVCFRLAENLFQLGDLTAARERYHAAIELDDEFVEARASLGCVLMELAKPDLAISAFEGALQYHPEYPDVLFHLARQLDEIGRGDQSEVHWRNFLEIAPQSPWADEARVRLGLLE